MATSLYFFRIIYFALLLSSVAYSAELPTFHAELQKRIFSSYINPNETHPQLATPVYQLARRAQGGLLSVGTERGFMVYSAMATPTSHLILVDIDPLVTQYNLINVGLLALSYGLEDYLNLRRTAHHSVWLERLKVSPLPSRMPQHNIITRILQSTDAFDNWRSKHTVEYFPNSLNFIERSPTSVLQPFYSMHYPSSPERYTTLRSAARQGMIHAANIDLASGSHLEILRSYLSQNKITLSLLDISNVPSWWSDLGFDVPIATKNIQQLLQILAPQLAQKSYVLNTQTNAEVKKNSLYSGMWLYSAFSTAYWNALQKNTDQLNAFVEQISSIEQSDHPNGNHTPIFQLFVTPRERTQFCEQNLI